MNTQIPLKGPLFPKALADLIHSNQFLKLFSVSMLVITGLCLAIILVMISRPPTVLALSPSAQLFEKSQMPKAEDQVREAIRAYIEYRYKWEPSNVIEKLKLAESFIGPQSFKAYQAAMVSVAKFSLEKQVSQRVYPGPVKVDLEKKTATIVGDRITSIQALRAVGELKLELSFDSGPRTRENPWGIYIAKEKEE